jgi:hypothetical protein
MQAAVDGVSVPPRGLVKRRGGHDRSRFGSETLVGEPAQVGNGALHPVESRRDTLGSKECGGKAIQPPPGRFQARRLAQQQEISPPMSRLGAADNKVVSPILDLCPIKPRQREIGLVTQRGDFHGSGL